jgi:hypothetical protein
MIEPALYASSEAIFGSAARGDFDQQSDRDILIVDTDLDVLKARSIQLSKAGWSVAAYTFEKLSALNSNGALFLQHLKLEAQITIDQDRRLTTLLRGFSPKKSYQFEIEQNSKIAMLAGEIPPSPRGALLAADILYVTVRNYGILRLAEQGIHTFAYSELLDALEAHRLISANGARELAPLRFLKCLYRSGELPPISSLIEAIGNALNVLPHDQFPDKLQMTTAKALLSASAPEADVPAYWQLRDLERRFVALQSLGANCEVNEQLLKLRRWIENPRAYAGISSRVAPAIRIMLHQQSMAYGKRADAIGLIEKLTKTQTQA